MDKKDGRGDTERPEADAQMGPNVEEEFLFRIVQLEPNISGPNIKRLRGLGDPYRAPTVVQVMQAIYSLTGKVRENTQISGHLWTEATSALLCHLPPCPVFIF